jgi:hypothetical protein
MRWWIGVKGLGGSLLGLLLNASVAQAQEGPAPAAPAANVAPPAAPVEGEVALSYVRGKGAEVCPDETAFRNHVLDLFDFADPFVAPGAAAAFQIRVELAKAPGRAFEAKITLADASGKAIGASSSDRHPDCEALVFRLAHAMGVTVLRRPPPDSPPPAACPACGEGAPCEPRVVHDCDAKCIEKIKDELCAQYGLCMDPTVLTVMAGGIATVGWTLEVGPGAMLGAEVRRDWLSFGLEARGFFPAAAQRYYASPPNSDLVSFSGLFVPCARWKWVLGCAFVEAGAFVFTVPYGLKGDYSDLLFRLGPRLAADVPIGQGFSLRAYADLAIHPFRHGREITDLNDPEKPVRVWQEPRVSGFFGVSLAWSR